MTAVYMCECGCEQSLHRGETYWCLAPACGCKRYTPDIQRAANVPPVMPGGESTSVLLRQAQTALAASQADLTRAEQERDDALAAQARISDRLTETVVRLAAYRRDREVARAELASALAELAQLRAATDTHRTEGEAP